MPIYKGTDSNPIQRVYKGDKECCVFKGNTLVHPAAVMYSTTSYNNWYNTPGNFTKTSFNQIYMGLSTAASPQLYGGNSPVAIISSGGCNYFKINKTDYYDIVWKASYVYDYNGAYQRLRILRFIERADKTGYESEATLAQSDSIRVQQTPVDMEVSIRRTYLTVHNVILVVSSVPSSLITESNAIATINKVP